MKYSRILFLAAAVTGLASCAMEEVKEFPVDKPEYLEQYEYLKEYDVLKNYVDRTASPDFKLGAGVDASKFVGHGQEYLLAVSNFDEMTAGNAMKHASVVGNNGKMNFDLVTSFVEEAEKAGITVYGHTLAWHSQQNNKFLNTLIADRVDPNYTPELVPVEKYIDRTCIEVVSQDMVSAAWDTQFWIMCPTEFKEGDAWEVSMDIYALTEAAPGTQTHKATPGDYLHWAAIGNPGFKTEWSTFTNSGTIEAAAAGGYSIAFNLNDLATGNTWYFDNISFKLNGVEQVVNGSCDDPEGTASFFAKEYPAPNPSPARIVSKYKKIEMVEIPKTQDIPRTCVVVESDDMVEQPWDTQFWLYFPDTPMKEGDSWEVSMEVRADKDASSGTQTHVGPGGYIHWAAIGTVNFTTEWETYTASGTVDGSMNTGDAIAFNLNDFPNANRYYFDNISFKLNGQEVITNGNCDDLSGNANFIAKEKRGAIQGATIVDHYTIELPGGNTPQTPEEKKDTLTKAMDAWIKGMMEATKGKVTAWDAVNEAIAGVDGDGDGWYDLQSADNGDPASNFYWQDYLGSLDYVRLVVNKAREYYVGTEPLKLFINDYNLESDWDDNKKLKSLIHWIGEWEKDGTVIDGIGTQMHVSCYANADIQASKEAHVVKMFELLKDSGKLVKISELDMGYIDMDGNPVPTTNMTEEQHQQMAAYYKFIVSKYLEIIPAAQQYGITQWCTTDASGALGTGWRGGEPVGLWDLNYGRKHTYAGFADGLQGK
ncbi:MAG: endo-1,4-beta-xylanase [Bacteroidales bacterium]|nr:endo-1,4-beta-xylanase [Bacteroidales bacterium]